ncbi:MAG TPA: hypothetical protein VMY79_01880 [Dehalococcoidia bacterium]|nr:hypothetical protein [Dehalococcoidia bacterium]
MLKRRCINIRGCHWQLLPRHCERSEAISSPFLEIATSPVAPRNDRRGFMMENPRIKVKLLVVALLLGLLFIPASAVWATSVDRLALCNLEGYPGETIEAQITLEGTDAEERSGYWYTHYKEVEGDDDRMDITSWITFEPEEYTIKQGEIKVFTVKVKISADAEPGLWGATSEEAGEAGHSDERRTYIIFKDAITGGNVYSGLLIPVSVKLLGNPRPLAPVIKFVRENMMVTALVVVIIILLAVLLPRRRKAS